MSFYSDEDNWPPRGETIVWWGLIILSLIYLIIQNRSSPDSIWTFLITIALGGAIFVFLFIKLLVGPQSFDRWWSLLVFTSAIGFLFDETFGWVVASLFCVNYLVFLIIFFNLMIKEDKQIIETRLLNIDKMKKQVHFGKKAIYIKYNISDKFQFTPDLRYTYNNIIEQKETYFKIFASNFLNNLLLNPMDIIAMEKTIFEDYKKLIIKFTDKRFDSEGEEIFSTVAELEIPLSSFLKMDIKNIPSNYFNQIFDKNTNWLYLDLEESLVDVSNYESTAKFDDKTNKLTILCPDCSEKNNVKISLAKRNYVFNCKECGREIKLSILESQFKKIKLKHAKNKTKK